MIKTKTGFVEVVQERGGSTTSHVFPNASAVYSEGVLTIRDSQGPVGIYPHGEVFRVVVHDDDPRKGAAS